MQNINPKRGRLWEQALLSGEYRQASEAFIEVDDQGLKHCCLAVATDVAMKHGCEDVRWSKQDVPMPQIRWNAERDDHYENYDYTTDDNGTIWIEYQDSDLPPPVSEWFGLVNEDVGTTNRSPKYDPLLDGERAIHRNDQKGESFGTIAKALAADLTRVEARS
jgi:hypothetical protein